MKKRSLMRRGLLAGTMLLAGGGAVAAWAAPAGASSAQVTAVGSATTYVVMHNLFPTSLNDISPTALTRNPTTTNQKIAATTNLCKGGVTYNKTSKPANGSGAGKTALHTEESNPTVTKRGCIDFSRSSSPPNPTAGKTVSTHFDYYSYALDGVSVMVGKNAGGTRATPVTVTLTEVKKMYRCKPGFTNWHTVTGGTSAPVVRFWPQSGSGTRTVYGVILGYTAFKDHTTTPTSTCTTLPFEHWTVGGKTKVNEENTEEGIIYQATLTPTNTPVADALYIYSSGKFASQWNTTSHYSKTHTNSITGTAIGNFNATTLLLAQMQNRVHVTTTAPFALFSPQSGSFTATTNRGSFSLNTGVVNETNEWFSHLPSSTAAGTTSTAAVPGVRYIFNVADTALPAYSEAKMMIGFDNKAQGAKSSLCNGDDASTILASGFIPLNTGSTAPATSDKAGSTCREFPGKHYPGFGGSKAWTTSTWVSPTA
jgi:hypothetical protein